MLTKKNLQLRVIASALCVAFISSELHAAPIDTLTRPSLSEQIVRNPEIFQAPSDFSTLSEIHPGNGNAFIIHIQDAHSNFSGQDNLAKTLDDLMSRYGVSLVLSEGGYGDCSLTKIKSIATPQVWKRVARSFLLSGKIQGEEYLNLVSDHPMKIMGIEDAVLYDKSVEAYRVLAEKRETVLTHLSKIERGIKAAKSKLYPKELLDYEKIANENFEKKFKAFVQLTGDIDQSGLLAGYPAIQDLIRVEEKEKLVNFDLASLEQAAMVEAVHQKGGADDLEASLEQMGQIKDNKVALFTHFQNTLNIAKEKGVDVDKFQNLLQYADYLREFSRIDFDKLTYEYEKAEDVLYQSIIENSRGDQKDTLRDALILRSVDRFVRLLSTAHEIKMTPDDYALFKANEPDFGTESMEAFLNRKLAENNYFEDMIPAEPILEEGRQALDAFYASVAARDVAFMRNVEEILKRENQKIAFLITGGYHTPHLKRLFQDKGYGYSVLTPTVTSETNQEKYESLILSQKSKPKKTVQLVEGQIASKGKSLAVVDNDLAKLMRKKNEDLREGSIVNNGARLSELVAAAGGTVPGSVASAEARVAQQAGNIIDMESRGKVREVFLTRLADGRWLSETNGKTDEFQVAGMNTPIPQEWMHQYPALLSGDFGEPGMLIHDGKLVGVYTLMRPKNEPPIIRFFIVSSDFRGSAAADVLLEDLRERLSQEQGKPDPTVRADIARRHERSVQGDYIGPLSGFKDVLGIASKVEVSPVLVVNGARMAKVETASPQNPSRRKFLLGAAAVGAGAIASGMAGVDAVKKYLSQVPYGAKFYDINSGSVDTARHFLNSLVREGDAVVWSPEGEKSIFGTNPIQLGQCLALIAAGLDKEGKKKLFFAHISPWRMESGIRRSVGPREIRQIASNIDRIIKENGLDPKQINFNALWVGPDNNNFSNSLFKQFEKLQGRNKKIQAAIIKGSSELILEVEAVGEKVSVRGYTDSGSAIVGRGAAFVYEIGPEGGMKKSVQGARVATADDLLLPEVASYDKAIKEIVNPQDKLLRSVYGGAGVDLVHWLLSTNATRGFFISQYFGTTRAHLDMFSRQPSSYVDDLERRAANYRNEKKQLDFAHSRTLTSRKNILAALWAELNSLGAWKSLKISQTLINEKYYPTLIFQWAYPGQETPTERMVTLIDGDVTNVKELRGLLEGLAPMDLYYQKAGMKIALSYELPETGPRENFITKMYEHMKPGGYFVTDDHASTDKKNGTPNFVDMSAKFPLELPILRRAGEGALLQAIFQAKTPPAQLNTRQAILTNNAEALYGEQLNIRKIPPQSVGARMAKRTLSPAVQANIKKTHEILASEKPLTAQSADQLLAALRDIRVNLDRVREEIDRSELFIPRDLTKERDRLMAQEAAIEKEMRRKNITEPSSGARLANARAKTAAGAQEIILPTGELWLEYREFSEALSKEIIQKYPQVAKQISVDNIVFGALHAIYNAATNGNRMDEDKKIIVRWDVSAQRLHIEVQDEGTNPMGENFDFFIQDPFGKGGSVVGKGEAIGHIESLFTSFKLIPINDASGKKIGAVQVMEKNLSGARLAAQPTTPEVTSNMNDRERKAVERWISQEEPSWVVYMDMMKLGLRDQFYGSKAADVFIASMAELVREKVNEAGGHSYRNGDRDDVIISALPKNFGEAEVIRVLGEIQEDTKEYADNHVYVEFPDKLTVLKRHQLEKISRVRSVELIPAELVLNEQGQAIDAKEKLFVLFEKTGGQDMHDALRQLLIDAEIKPDRRIIVKKVLPPFMPAGAVISTPNDTFETLLERAEKYQGIAKDRGWPWGVNGAVELRQQERRDNPLYSEKTETDINQKLTDLREQLKSLAKVIKQARPDFDYEIEEEYAAFERRALRALLLEAKDDKTKEKKQYIVRGPPDSFFVIQSDGEGAWRIIKTQQSIYALDESRKRKFDAIQKSSGRGGEEEVYGFKQINDLFGHFAGNELIKLNNLFLAQHLQSLDFSDSTLIPGALSRAASDINSLVKNDGFEVGFTATVVDSTDFIDVRSQTPERVLKKLDDLSAAGVGKQIEEKIFVSLYSDNNKPGQWDRVQRKNRVARARRRDNAGEELLEIHQNLDLSVHGARLSSDDYLLSARRFVDSVVKSPGYQVTYVGPGEFHNRGATRWETLFLEKGANVTLYEPDLMSSLGWEDAVYRGDLPNSQNVTVVPYREAYFEKNTLKNNTVDTVILLRVLTHWNIDPFKRFEILIKAVDVLKNGGYLVLGDIADDHLHYIVSGLNEAQTTELFLKQLSNLNVRLTKIAEGSEKNAPPDIALHDWTVYRVDKPADFIAPKFDGTTPDARLSSEALAKKEVADSAAAEPFSERVRAISNGARMAGGELNPGDKVGDYKILELIKSGAYGSVYKVRSLSALGEIRALKTSYSPHSFSRHTSKGLSHLKESLQGEKLILEEISKRLPESVVKKYFPRILDAGHISPEADYFVMDYFDGQTLADYNKNIRRDQRPDSYATSLSIVDQILQALESLHSAGLVFNDLKLENIIIDKEYGVKVIDFGGVSYLDQKQQRIGENMSRFGALGSESPEQIRQEVTDVRSDVFLVGLILHKLLTGQPRDVYVDMDPRDLVLWTKNLMDSGQLPRLPKDVMVILETSLEFYKEDRYQSALEMRNAVKAAIQNLDRSGSAIPLQQGARLTVEASAEPLAFKERVRGADIAQPTPALGERLRSLSAGARLVDIVSTATEPGLPTGEAGTKAETKSLQTRALAALEPGLPASKTGTVARPYSLVLGGARLSTKIFSGNKIAVKDEELLKLASRSVASFGVGARFSFLMSGPILGEPGGLATLQVIPSGIGIGPIGGAPTVTVLVNKQWTLPSKETLPVVFIPHLDEIRSQMNEERRQIRILKNELAELGFTSDSLEGALGIRLDSFDAKGDPNTFQDNVLVLLQAVREIKSSYPRVQFYFYGRADLAENAMRSGLSEYQISPEAWNATAGKRVILTDPKVILPENTGFVPLATVAKETVLPARPMLHLALYLLGVREKIDKVADVSQEALQEWRRLAGNPTDRSLESRHILAFAKGNLDKDLMQIASSFMIRPLQFINAKLSEYLTALQAVGEAA